MAQVFCVALVEPAVQKYPGLQRPEHADVAWPVVPHDPAAHGKMLVAPAGQSGGGNEEGKEEGFRTELTSLRAAAAPRTRAGRADPGRRRVRGAPGPRAAGGATGRD